MSDNSGQSASGQEKRRALHQRSDSDTNAQSLAPTPKRLSDEPDFVVSSKGYSVSIWSSSNSSKNVSGTDRPQHPARHRRTQTDSSNNGSSGHSRSNTRSTIQSQKSLDSFPPVPPLRIQKDEISLVTGEGSAAATAQLVTAGYTAGEGAGEQQEHEAQQAARPRSSLRLPALPAPVLSYHGLSNPELSGLNAAGPSSPANAPSPLRLPPKSILKKPSNESSNFADYEDNSSSLDPSSAVSETSSNRFRNPRSSTSYEYLRRSRAWAGALPDDSLNRERMNAHTLRAVPASSDGASFTTEDSYAGDVVPAGLGVRGGTIRPIVPSHERMDSHVSASSSLGGESEMKGAGLPAWTR